MKKTAVLLVNLGTPNSPHPKDVYNYLIEFLTDGRVIDKPWIYRQLLVRGLIVPLRYRQSAKSYQKIWLKDGSPLMIYSQKVQRLLQEKLGESFHVELAMRYQNPSIEKALNSLMSQGFQHLIIIPLFPQYASSTTGSVHEKILKQISKYTVIPKLTFIDHFMDHPLYIETIADIASQFDLNAYDHILFSFHGLPQKHLTKANADCYMTLDCCKTRCKKRCYKADCHSTAKAIANQLKLKTHNYSICFQSRLGKEAWTEPFTIDRIKALRKEGMKKLLVFCPSFVSDCLETIYEIGIEYAEEFMKEGGEVLHFVPSLNDHPKWIETLESIIKDVAIKKSQ